MSLHAGYPDGVTVDTRIAHALEAPIGAVVSVMPYFKLCEGDGFVRAWTRPDRDLMAEDWYVVDGPRGQVSETVGIVEAVRDAYAVRGSVGFNTENIDVSRGVDWKREGPPLTRRQRERGRSSSAGQLVQGEAEGGQAGQRGE